MKFQNRLCQNILKYNKNSNLEVTSRGKITKSRYYCTTADLLNNSKFIRFAAIADGSCLLHAISTADDVYVKLNKKNKIKFIKNLRNKLAEKINQLSIDKLFSYFGRYIWDFIMDGDPIVVQSLNIPLSVSLLTIEESSEGDESMSEEMSKGDSMSEGDESDQEKLSKIWQSAIHKIDLEKICSYEKMKKIIIKKFKNEIPNLEELLDLGIQYFRLHYYNLIKNMHEWLGAPEYLFLCEQLDANFLILRFNQYGIVYTPESGNTAFINPKYKNNYIIAWDETHYELVGVEKKNKLLRNFPFSSPVIQMLVNLSSRTPFRICKKFPLLSMFYNNNPREMNMPYPFLFPLKILSKRISPAKAPIAFTKSLVRKIKKDQGHKYITQCLKFIIKKYNFTITQSFSIQGKSNFWKQMTKKNIANCFSQSESNVSLADWAIEVSKNGQQLAVACLNIDTPLNIHNQYIPDNTDNIGFIYNLCVPERYRQEGNCKKLMQEIKYLINSDKKSKRSRRSRIRKSLKRKNILLPKVNHIKKKISKFYLEVYENNLAAIKCYTSINFITIATYIKNNKNVLLLELE